MQTDDDTPHIGLLIQEELQRQGRSARWLSEQLCYGRGNIYRIFRSRSIDTDTLYRISKALHVNFFTYYDVH